MKTCKNFFFQCKTAFDARAETPPEGAINAPRGHQMLLFAMNQLHSPTEQQEPKKEIKMKKTFSKKWVWRQLHTLGLPAAASLKKGCLEHNQNAGFYTSEHHAAARDAVRMNML